MNGPRGVCVLQDTTSPRAAARRAPILRKSLEKRMPGAFGPGHCVWIESLG